MIPDLEKVRSILFDLDGSLFVGEALGGELFEVASRFVGASRGVGERQARRMIQDARNRLVDLYEQEPSLALTCVELGIEMPDYHRALQRGLLPERYLHNDPILVALLESLGERFSLFAYTSHDLPMARKIMAILGVEELFRRTYTVEFGWRPKPDLEGLKQVLEDIGGTPESFLYVGDRHHSDLQMPQTLGLAAVEVREPEDLLRIHKLAGLLP